MEKTVTYRGAEISVNEEVAAFLEQDRKRMQAQERSDRRHLSKSDFEQLAMTTCSVTDADYVFDLIWKNLQLEKLRMAMDTLAADEQRLVELYYMENMSMKDIGNLMGGVSKMAISKRLNKLLLNLRSLMET